MTNVSITSGVIKYGRTVKTGDFESKRADIELAFSVAEGEDVDAAITHVENIAIGHLFDILGNAADQGRRANGMVKATEPKKSGRPPKLPAVAGDTAKNPPADQASVVEEPAAAVSPAKPAAPAVEENLDDILGVSEPVGKKEITDKELTDATQKQQSAVKNSPAIRKLLESLGVKPPGRLIDLPQEKRQEYLDKLKEIKPLA